MREPKGCITINCKNRDKCEYAAIWERALKAFPNAEERYKYSGVTIHPVACGCKRYEIAPRII